MQTELIRNSLTFGIKLLADPDIPPFQEPDDMAGILADLRRNPDCLAIAFAPLPKGEELLDRVSLCIGLEKRDHGAYLIPETINATDEQLLILVLEAITRGCQCVELLPQHTQSTSCDGE